MYLTFVINDSSFRLLLSAPPLLSFPHASVVEGPNSLSLPAALAVFCVELYSIISVLLKRLFGFPLPVSIFNVSHMCHC